MHVIDGLPLGGAERMLVDIANATVANGDFASVCVNHRNVRPNSSISSRLDI